MLIKIDFESDTPIYEQIKNQIIEGIAAGDLAEGEPLPSVRQFAADTGINMHTVNKAYSLLQNDGFVTVHKRKGVIIKKMSQMHSTGYVNEISKTVKTVIAKAYCKGVTEKEFIQMCKEVYLSFNKG